MMRALLVLLVVALAGAAPAQAHSTRRRGHREYWGRSELGASCKNRLENALPGCLDAAGLARFQELVTALPGWKRWLIRDIQT